MVQATATLGPVRRASVLSPAGLEATRSLCAVGPPRKETAVLRDSLLSAARNPQVERMVTSLPVTRQVVNRYVPGEHVEDAVRATRELAADGLHTTIDFLGEDIESPEQADETVEAYLDLLARLGSSELTKYAEVSVKLSALGQSL